MPQPYNLTNISGSSNLYDFMTEANVLADGYIGVFIVIVMWLILFMAFKKFETKIAFTTSSFIVALISILLKIMGWINTSYMTVPIIMVAIGFIWLTWGD